MTEPLLQNGPVVPQATTKVGFAAIQEMARKQEEMLLRGGEAAAAPLLRLNPEAKTMSLQQRTNGPTKFPLEVPASPLNNRRAGTARYFLSLLFSSPFLPFCLLFAMHK